MQDDLAEREARLQVGLNLLGYSSLEALEDFIFVNGACTLVPLNPDLQSLTEETQQQSLSTTRTVVVSPTRLNESHKARKEELKKSVAENARLKKEIDWIRKQWQDEKKVSEASRLDFTRVLSDLNALREQRAKVADQDELLAARKYGLEAAQEIERLETVIQELEEKVQELTRTLQDQEEKHNARLLDVDFERRHKDAIMDKKSAQTTLQAATVLPPPSQVLAPHLVRRLPQSQPTAPLPPSQSSMFVDIPVPLQIPPTSQQIRHCENYPALLAAYLRERQSLIEAQTFIRGALSYLSQHADKVKEKPLPTPPALLSLEDLPIEYPSLEEIPSSEELSRTYNEIRIKHDAIRSTHEEISAWRDLFEKATGMTKSGQILMKKKRKPTSSSSTSTRRSPRKLSSPNKSSPLKKEIDMTSDTLHPNSSPASRESSVGMPTPRKKSKRISDLFNLPASFARFSTTNPIIGAEQPIVAETDDKQVEGDVPVPVESSYKQPSTQDFSEPEFEAQKSSQSGEPVQSTPITPPRSSQPAPLSQSTLHTPLVLPSAAQPFTSPPRDHSPTRSHTPEQTISPGSRQPFSRSPNPNKTGSRKKPRTAKERAALSPPLFEKEGEGHSTPLVASRTRSKTVDAGGGGEEEEADVKPNVLLASPRAPSIRRNPISRRKRGQEEIDGTTTVKEEEKDDDLFSIFRKKAMGEGLMKANAVLGPPPTPPADWEAVRRAEEKRSRQRRRASEGDALRSKVDSREKEESNKKRGRYTEMQGKADEQEETEEETDIEENSKRSKSGKKAKKVINEKAKGKTKELKRVPTQTELELGPSSDDEHGYGWMDKLHAKRRADAAAIRENRRQASTAKAFELDPDKNGGETHAYVQVERKKAAREKMLATTCDRCTNWYKETGYNITCKHTISTTTKASKSNFLEDQRRLMEEQRLQDMSRHRVQQLPDPTPPDYWQLGFPGTLKVKEINHIARENAERKRAYQEEEAEKGGRYRYRN